jgi:hypothetical protein
VSTTTDPTLIINRMLAHIGRPTILAVSGGRIAHSTTDLRVILPVGHGYAVEVTYEKGLDLYAVERVFTRGLKRSSKGYWAHVYSDDLAEVVYRASLND